MDALPANSDKPTTAAWMGYRPGLAGIADMDEEHDSLHEKLCEWLGMPSYSMAIARGEQVTERQKRLANYEEDAVLWLQRLIQHARVIGAAKDERHG